MMHINYKILMVNFLLSVTCALQSGSSSDTYEDKLHSIDVLTYDQKKGRYYYQPLFAYKEGGVYSLCFPRTSTDQIDLGPLSCFGLQKKYQVNENDFEYDEQREQRVRELGPVKYDEDMGVYYHSKLFNKDSLKSGMAAQPRILEWLLMVDVLSFDILKRKYYYEHLFSGGNEYDNKLQLYQSVSRELHLGPLDYFGVRLIRMGRDTANDMCYFEHDPEVEVREQLLGPIESDAGRGLICHSKVFE